MSNEPHWVASWIAAVLTLGQIALLIALGGGEIIWLRSAGFAFWTLAAVFGCLPIYQLKRHGGVAKGASYMETTQVVDTGIYAIVRHPQFVAWPLMNVALAFMSQNPMVVAMGAAAFVLACVDFRTVDARNVDKFGDAYRDYVIRVPGWNFIAGLWRWAQRATNTSRSA